MTQPAEELRPTETAEFANSLLFVWEEIMDRFFDEVERKQKAKGLTDEQVRAALRVGYGDEVADAWDEWREE